MDLVLIGFVFNRHAHLFIHNQEIDKKYTIVYGPTNGG